MPASLGKVPADFVAGEGWHLPGHILRAGPGRGRAGPGGVESDRIAAARPRPSRSTSAAGRVYWSRAATGRAWRWSAYCYCSA
ncbi:hypothetical protein [Streptomyces endophytica]|uniref:Uncharacterized protein n=1 Tax=Streptomyces endophytica TaxID=2991496 RepID=A0ABY6PBM6_9ACTN|nr:hypothetical protein [Streptomyces endophytica]UZJ31243.1 hypothetical protein OJ254_14085 [Streptomyces endophytica]